MEGDLLFYKSKSKQDMHRCVLVVNTMHRKFLILEKDKKTIRKTLPLNSLEKIARYGDDSWEISTLSGAAYRFRANSSQENTAWYEKLNFLIAHANSALPANLLSVQSSSAQQQQLEQPQGPSLVPAAMPLLNKSSCRTIRFDPTAEDRFDVFFAGEFTNANYTPLFQPNETYVLAIQESGIRVRNKNNPREFLNFNASVIKKYGSWNERFILLLGRSADNGPGFVAFEAANYEREAAANYFHVTTKNAFNQLLSKIHSSRPSMAAVAPKKNNNTTSDDQPPSRRLSTNSRYDRKSSLSAAKVAFQAAPVQFNGKTNTGSDSETTDSEEEDDDEEKYRKALRAGQELRITDNQPRQQSLSVENKRNQSIDIDHERSAASARPRYLSQPNIGMSTDTQIPIQLPPKKYSLNNTERQQHQKLPRIDESRSRSSSIVSNPRFVPEAKTAATATTQQLKPTSNQLPKAAPTVAPAAANKHRPDGDSDESDESFYQDKFVPQYVSNKHLASPALDYFADEANASVYGRVKL